MVIKGRADGLPISQMGAFVSTVTVFQTISAARPDRCGKLNAPSGLLTVSTQTVFDSIMQPVTMVLSRFNELQKMLTVLLR